MRDYKIDMIRGDTLAFGVEIEGLNKSVDTAFFTCRKNYEDENPVFQKSLLDGISEVETGKYRVRVAPEDTENLEEGLYYYDLEIGVNSDVFTILKGTLKIEHDVTF